MGKLAQEKHVIVDAMVAKNITRGVIAKTLGYTPEHTSRLIKKSPSFQLLTRKRIKNAVKAVDYFTDIDNYHEDSKIKPSDVLAASNVILSRSHPVQSQEQSPSVNISLSLQDAHRAIFDIDNATNPTDNTLVEGEK